MYLISPIEELQQWVVSHIDVDLTAGGFAFAKSRDYVRVIAIGYAGVGVFVSDSFDEIVIVFDQTSSVEQRGVILDLSGDQYPF